MEDINGVILALYDTISSDAGTGRIVEYLGAGNARSGALVRIEVGSLRSKVDIALRLAKAMKVIHTSKYGV